MTRLVLDTDVFVSALISGSGPPARLLEQWEEGAFELLVSDRLLDEVDRVLRRRKFEAVDEKEIAELLARLRQRARRAPDPTAGSVSIGDPADEFLVRLALSARADAIVSGDAHLTSLPESVFRVLTPREAVDLLEHT